MRLADSESILLTACELGAIFCAKVSRCRVVELNPIVTNFTMSGHVKLVLWLYLTSKVEPSFNFFFFFALFPFDRITVDALNSPIGLRRLDCGIKMS